MENPQNFSLKNDPSYTSINRKIGKAIHSFSLIEAGDSILVAVSGGKDSILMLEFLLHFQSKAPIQFSIHPLHVDQGGPFADNVKNIQELVLLRTGLECKIVHEAIYPAISKISQSGNTPCALCGRLRRGVLMSSARRFGCNKIALGHHADDAMETLLMNAFFNGKIGSMSPHYRVGKGDLQIIRPLYLVSEAEIRDFAVRNEIPTVTCSFCQSAGGFKRRELKNKLSDLEKEYPSIKGSLLSALSNIHAEEMADRRFWKERDFSVPDG